VVSAFTADRLQSKGNGSNYYPYGESKTSTAGDDREGFATYTRDEKSGLDYADQRWYASGVGRFGSVDPNIANANTNRGGSWNAYAYTEGNPVNSNDPSGLLGEGCGTWWEGARDFGHCGGGRSGGGDGCESSKAGCVGIGGGFALVPCFITDPTSSYFGSVGFCGTSTGGEDGDAIGSEDCIGNEALYLLGYLGRRRSPLADLNLLKEWVTKSNEAGIDVRFIIALSGVETTYGKNNNQASGTYNIFSNQNHCAEVGNPTATYCKGKNPFNSYDEAFQDAIDNLSQPRYAVYSKAQDIYSIWERGDVRVVSSRQGLLNTIFGSQLSGDLNDMRKIRCPKK